MCWTFFPRKQRKQAKEKMQCMKSELDLFELHPLQTNVLGVEQVAYNPVTTLNNSSNIEFVVPGNGDTYKNLSSIYLRLLVELKDKKGDVPKGEENVEASKKIGVVNNLLHSLFRQCTVSLNNIQVCQDNDYHYKAFFQTILNYGADAVKTHLETTGWKMDEQELDSLSALSNPAFVERNSWFESSTGFTKKLELYGKLHVDLFSQPRYLLNNVDLKVTLHKEKSDFYMLESSINSSDINILEANLFVEHVHLNPAVLLAHHQILAKTTAKYPFKRVSVRQYTIASGTSNLSIDNLIMNVKPNILLFTMLTNAAYSGSRHINPFNFKSFDLEQFVLYVDGRQTPSRPIVMKHSPTKGYLTARAYNTLFSGTGLHYFNQGHQISKKLFDSCCFMLAFDLTADHSYSSICSNPVSQCSIRIEGSFRKNLTEAITCLILCEYDSQLEIDNTRSIAITI